MDLVDFARGPALRVAFIIFFIGVAWRLVNVLLHRHRHNLSEPRRGVGVSLLGAFVAVGSRSWPHPEFIARTSAGETIGYGYHIGLFIVLLLFAPHITFFGSFFGVSWWALPNSVVTIIAVLTFTLLLAALLRRLANGVMRRISNFDDYFSWFLVALVMVTGLAATAHAGARYQTLLGLHILSFDALLIWFPFGKLMHAFFLVPTRAVDGYLLTRKGAPS